MANQDQGYQYGAPLAEQLRPHRLDEIMGQDHVIGPKTSLGQRLLAGTPPSMIVYGPPGTGKTSFARIVAQMIPSAEFHMLNAVGAGVKDLREIGEKAHEKRIAFKQRTILFVDEIHRFNKGQQDVLLPYVESGDLVLIGATTENPAYELNRALLSRCQLVAFKSLERPALDHIFKAAVTPYLEKYKFSIFPEASDYLLNVADGDARRLINSIEAIFNQIDASQGFVVQHDEVIEGKASIPQRCIDLEFVQNAISKPILAYDKNSQHHYDMISAFIKSIRGSDPDAALYWMVRMLEGGEDASFIARRLVILASEDVGNADPRALAVAVSVAQAVEMIGLPEAQINLAQAVTYLSSCPKSNASYMALHRAKEVVDQSGSQAVPVHLTSLGKKDYKYPHDFPKSWVDQNYLPESVQNRVQKSGGLYQPLLRGFEKQIREFYSWIKG